MGGIAGIHYKHDVEAAVLDRAVAHFGARLCRGGDPADLGVHRNARAVYAQRRPAASIPAILYGADPARGIVCRGEIHNAAALRRALEGRYPFITAQADTEVALASVLVHGEAALAELDGPFALCVWDELQESFLLARDRFGARPLFVYEDEHCIAFADVLGTLLGLPRLDHAPDPAGLQDLLSHGHPLAPHTMFARIRRLPAGSMLHFSRGQSQTRRFAELALREPAAARDEAEAVAELDARLTRAVQSRLADGAPTGVLLSGGLGASAIAACAQRTGTRLTAYSWALPGLPSSPAAREVARRLELDHVELELTQQVLHAGLDAWLQAMDEPLGDPAGLALSQLYGRARNDVAVLLSDEGCDEMLAGRPQHQLALVPGLSRDTVCTHYGFRSDQAADVSAWLRDKSLPPQPLRLRAHFDLADTALNGLQSLELNGRLPEHLMARAHALLQAHTLAGRFPFLDLGLWRLVTTLPQALRLPHAASPQHVLRQLLARRLPASALRQGSQDMTGLPALWLPALHARLSAALDALRERPVGQVLDLDAAAESLRRWRDGDTSVRAGPAWRLAVMLLWWAEVYPALCAGPEPASGSLLVSTVPARPRLVIYTALVGAKETLANPLDLLPQGATTDLDIDWVCVTDNPALRSPVWRMLLIPSGHVPPEKLSRRPKALPHEYFPDAQYSLYVDNTVSFKRLPQSGDLATGRPYLFRAFRHATRSDPASEAAAVATLGYDDVGVICQQIDFYAQRRPLGSISPLTTATVLLRQHHHPLVKAFGVLWWESLLAFSKRDQISFDFALHEAGAEVEYFEGSTSDNAFIHWNGSLSPQRVQANFDPKRYAWLHRDDPEAARDPKGHFLARGGGSQEAYLRDSALLEFACHMNGSSLGRQVSPRRGMADALEALLGARRVAGCRFALVCVHGRDDPWAFEAAELHAGATALATFLSPARGTLLELDSADLVPGGKVYALAETPFDLLIVLGAGGEQLGPAVEQLMRMLSPRSGQLVAVLSSPASVRDAAEAECALARHLGLPVQASLQASRHDGAQRLRPNTVIGFEWTAPPAPGPA